MERPTGGNGTTIPFAGFDYDRETNLDHTDFRKYSSQLGRWMHPDPGGVFDATGINGDKSYDGGYHFQ